MYLSQKTYNVLVLTSLFEMENVKKDVCKALISIYGGYLTNKWPEGRFNTHEWKDHCTFDVAWCISVMREVSVQKSGRS